MKIRTPAVVAKTVLALAATLAVAGAHAESQMKEYLTKSNNPPFTGSIYDVEESGKDGYSATWDNCNADAQCVPHAVTFTIRANKTITIVEGPQIWTGKYERNGNKIDFDVKCGGFNGHGVLDLDD